MNKVYFCLFLAFVSFAPDTFSAEIEWAEKKGVVREIDLSGRTAVIAGFRYYFGTSYGYQTPDIELIYYPKGTFEMLEVGMKVQFHYTQRKPYRRILRLRQLPDDAWFDEATAPDDNR